MHLFSDWGLTVLYLKAFCQSLLSPSSTMTGERNDAGLLLGTCSWNFFWSEKQKDMKIRKTWPCGLDFISFYFSCIKNLKRMRKESVKPLCVGIKHLNSNSLFLLWQWKGTLTGCCCLLVLLDSLVLCRVSSFLLWPMRHRWFVRSSKVCFLSWLLLVLSWLSVSFRPSLRLFFQFLCLTRCCRYPPLK